MQTIINLIFPVLLLLIFGCGSKESVKKNDKVPEPDFTITSDQTHNRFSKSIPPVVQVPDGNIIEAFALEATGQLNINSSIEDYKNIDRDKIHTLTGPIYIDGAEAGDVLAVELLELEPGDWGWIGLSPDFGFLPSKNQKTVFKTYKLDKEDNLIHFRDGISIPMKPFAGVMGVAPDTDSMLVTFPPRANGGNMDNPNLVAGVTVYFPVFVKGALFSIGDPHAAQGMGEVVGTAVEVPMRIRFRVKVIKNRSIAEPQYESDEYYATTGFGTTIDEAAVKATQYMVEYIMETHGLSWEESYMLCSIAGDLKIAEVVDLPNMLVTMHISKNIFNNQE